MSCKHRGLSNPLQTYLARQWRTVGAHETSKEVVLGEKSPRGLAYSPICSGKVRLRLLQLSCPGANTVCPQQVLKGVEGKEWRFH